MSDSEDLHIPAGVLANAPFSLPNPDETDDLEEGISHERAHIEPRGATPGTPDGYTIQGVIHEIHGRIKADIEDMLADFRGRLKGLRSSAVQVRMETPNNSK
ncbi:hypothetical protein L198_04807 [Cryptococcus wingfieldii CBS 7118]|uniref:Uncharacterized protein n=1 Tax=Cryptococcus wingfieldii CBS 7118 TaxID=1295528 RepID=A0A1E3J3H1_9TREE|nr:hypothetical protein L198_04807 [Cryptococcus wingfieldii CBS 7118]ODN94666.1 hypothetical protein L198_04807 [Cryptococcus wingfieldii CBS 7118]